MVTAQLLAKQQGRLKKALGHLRYSFAKVQALPTDPALLDDEQLEVWESFSARHARVVELFLTKYLRALVLRDDPAFDGTLRDLLNRGEKAGYVTVDVDTWLALRSMRNSIAHDYSDEETSKFFAALRSSATTLLNLPRDFAELA